jgi:hypothetical protein
MLIFAENKAMKFKPGDKVKFLNDSGGGIITKIISPQMVSVAIEEGFEVPTMTSELLKIESNDPGSRFFVQNYKVVPEAGRSYTPETDYSRPQPEEEPLDRIFPLQRVKGPEADSIWLAFRPHDQKWFITGLLDICLLNPTGYDILYSLLLHEQSGFWNGTDYDVVSPESGITLATVKREELNNWLEGTVQILFQKEKQAKLVMPANAAFHLKPTRFQKEDNYISNAFIYEKALLINLTNVQGLKTSPEKLSGTDPEFSPQTKVAVQKPKAFIDKHRIAPFEAEVDLHISALQDNYTNLSNHEILKIQTDYFSKSLESALASQYRKIIFIHGIGNGTLRNTLLQLLKEYEELTARNAPFKKYGYEAIEVVSGKPE